MGLRAHLLQGTETVVHGTAPRGAQRTVCRTLGLALLGRRGGVEKANPCLLLKSKARPLSLHPALVSLPTLVPPLSAMKLAVLVCSMVCQPQFAENV